MSKHILIVEDDPCLQDVYTIILEQAGHHVTVASNADIIFGKDYLLPNLYLLDKQLAGKDGLEVCRFLKTNPDTQHIPVIIVSAAMNIHNLAKTAGADACIGKPFDNKVFLETIEGQLHHAHSL
jgi:two-component system phosphate regulon response regulator PhoB/two-component system alkaline phosphatase synthesis response regulator PhoP